MYEYSWTYDDECSSWKRLGNKPEKSRGVNELVQKQEPRSRCNPTVHARKSLHKRTKLWKTSLLKGISGSDIPPDKQKRPKTGNSAILRSKGVVYGMSSRGIDEQMLLEILSSKSYTNVGALYKEYCSKMGEVSKGEFDSKIKELDKNGRIDLLGQIVEIHSLRDYFANLDESLWFYVCMGVAGLTFFLALEDTIYPWEIARWIIGSFEVTVTVGYATMKAIFPDREEFDSIERTALAVAVSVSVSALIGLVVDISPYGLRAFPVLVALTAYVVAITLVALVRSYSWRRKNIASQPKKQKESV
jgi:hypothetical protein